ncbi:MAG: heavy-metal-associated domain-containing protein [Candidatus Doudnabacteria bacterium]|nr:heavy-metal-associated domain-containing protein [Candidatus Doudnabacteria bacterium]
MKKILLFGIPILLIAVIGIRFATKPPHSNPSATSVTSSTQPQSLHHLAMKVGGMYCASCPYNVENALKDTPGVVNATAGFTTGAKIINGTVEGEAEVIYDANQTSLDKLVQAILPYKGKLLSDEPTASTTLTPLSKTVSF